MPFCRDRRELCIGEETGDSGYYVFTSNPDADRLKTWSDRHITQYKERRRQARKGWDRQEDRQKWEEGHAHYADKLAPRYILRLAKLHGFSGLRAATQWDQVRHMCGLCCSGDLVAHGSRGVWGMGTATHQRLRHHKLWLRPPLYAWLHFQPSRLKGLYCTFIKRKYCISHTNNILYI